MPVVPVRVEAKDSNRTVETYAFLDGGSSTSFVAEYLLKKLGAKGYQTILSLTIMEKERSNLRSPIASLERSDLDGPLYSKSPFSVFRYEAASVKRRYSTSNRRKSLASSPRYHDDKN
ncbi:Hypothetical predicted protein [Paramuricea clavata]|uniref:Uncharacterized protein n=1 Tax=Paramuricea clavata TaxID=317549 RepID=A0A7D9KC98_PARCT|nr:Hypothetical predicted protein [Paramuricea clavata]